MSRRSVPFLAAACLALAAPPSRADLGPGIVVKLENLAGPAVIGQPLAFGVRLEAGTAVTLRNFQVLGGTASGGPPAMTGLPDSLPLAPGVPAHLALATVPTGGDLVYRFEFTMGRRRVVRFFDLSRGHFDRMFRANQSVELPDVALPVADPAWRDDPGPGPEAARPAFLKPLRDLRAVPAGVRATTGRWVRVKGRVTYVAAPYTYGADRLTVKILDQETGPSDDLLDELRTEPDGTFDVNVWSDEEEPDLYLEFATRNGAAEVQDGTWNTSYKWETGVKVDFGGATADFMNHSPPDALIKAAVQMHSNLTKAYRWYKNVVGITPPKQALEWPSGDWPHYDSYAGDIHIPITVGGQGTYKYAWATDTHIHEYGHAMMHEVQGYAPSHDYDNGICNNDNGDPGHCTFCEEDAGSAIKEGFANYFADAVLTDWPSAYGTQPDDTRSQEWLPEQCLDNGTPKQPCDCNPYVTEGNFGRLLRDLADASNEADPQAMAGGADLVTVGSNNVVGMFHWFDIDTPAEYILRFRETFPGIPPGTLWLTLANSQYVLDDNTPPPVPPNLHSTDHALNELSPDPTITMAWSVPADDFSGVERYRLWYRAAPAGNWVEVLPPGYPDVQWITGLTAATPSLAPGWYDFRIQAIDRAGNASAYGLLGSYGIREPLPADLTSVVPSGWTSHLVPRDAGDATSGSCALPAQLDGGVNNTWLNVAGVNAGESPPENIHRVRLLIDGVPVDSTNFGFTPAGSQFLSQNRGPRVVRGGRHTLEAWYDAAEASAEISETNNRKGRQYTWTGEKVAIGQRVRRAAPPDPTGGHNSFLVLPPAAKYRNVDGLYYSHTTSPPLVSIRSWAAMSVASVRPADDYDCYLQSHSTGTGDGGWTDGLVTSARPAGELDAVVTNTAASWDVGVLNTSRGTNDYLAECVASPLGALEVGDSISITLADSSFLALRALQTPFAAAKLLVDVQRVAGTAPIYTLWLADDHTYGTIAQYDGKAGTDSLGASSLTVTSPSSAEHGLVFYRNPKDGFGAVTFTVRVRQKPGDPAPVAPAGWFSALVPRPLADGTPASVPAPAFLPGESAFTHLNAAFRNQSDAPTGLFRVNLNLDRSLVGQLLYPFGVAANAQVTANNVSPLMAPAGRHVLHMTLDAAGEAVETNEANNRHGAQWVWAPPASPLATPLWRRGTNGSPVEGWDACDPGALLAFNVDGLRSPVFGAGNAAGWAGFATVPVTGGDVDLQLFDPATGPTSGFDEALAFSQWDGDATDFVLVNFAATPYAAFDAGVVRASDDTTSYLANIAGAVLRSPAAGVHGPFTLPGGRVLELHAFDLGAGHHVVDLVNQSGGVDWGLAAYGGPRPFQNRSDGEDLGASDAAGPGGHEQVAFDLAAPGRVCVAVWKTGAAEQGKNGVYALTVNSPWLDAGPAATASTRLLGARPSPFTSATRIEYELAAGTDVEVEVFDVSGARVATLERGARPAGRHAVSWAGDDERGRALPPGLYLVRLRAAGVAATTKLVRTR